MFAENESQELIALRQKVKEGLSLQQLDPFFKSAGFTTDTISLSNIKEGLTPLTRLSATELWNKYFGTTGNIAANISQAVDPRGETLESFEKRLQSSFKREAGQEFGSQFFDLGKAQMGVSPSGEIFNIDQQAPDFQAAAAEVGIYTVTNPDGSTSQYSELNAAIAASARSGGQITSTPKGEVAGLKITPTGATVTGIKIGDAPVSSDPNVLGARRRIEIAQERNENVPQEIIDMAQLGISGEPVSPNIRKLGSTEFRNLRAEWRAAGLTDIEIEQNFLERPPGSADIFLKTDAPSSTDIIQGREVTTGDLSGLVSPRGENLIPGDGETRTIDLSGLFEGSVISELESLGLSLANLKLSDFDKAILTMQAGRQITAGQNLTQIKADRDALIVKLEGAFDFDSEQKLRDLEVEMKIAQKEQDLDNIIQQMADQETALRNGLIQIEGQPISLSLIGVQQNLLKQQAAAMISSLAAKGEIIQGNLNRATTRINNYYNAAINDANSQISKFKTLLDFASDDIAQFSKAETDAFNEQINILTESQKRIIEDRDKVLNLMLTNAEAFARSNATLDMPFEQIVNLVSDQQATLDAEERASILAARGRAGAAAGDATTTAPNTAFWSTTNTGRNELQQGEPWGNVWNRIKAQFPNIPDATIDRALSGQLQPTEAERIAIGEQILGEGVAGAISFEDINAAFNPNFDQADPRIDWARAGAFEKFKQKNPGALDPWGIGNSLTSEEATQVRLEVLEKTKGK